MKTKMMIAATLLTPAAVQANAMAAAPHATAVRANATDPLTKRFADALRGAIPKAKNMRAFQDGEPDDISLAVLYDVQPDDAGKRFSYAVDLMKSNGDGVGADRLDSFTGTCRESAIDVCATELVAKADKKVRD